MDEDQETVRRLHQELSAFRQFAHSWAQGFVIADLDGRVTYANPALCRLIGERDPERVRGRLLSEMYAPKSRQRLEETVIPTAVQRGQWAGRMRLRGPKGPAAVTEQDFLLVRDENGRPRLLAAVVVEVTERNRAEKMLRKEHRAFRHLLKSLDRERRLISHELHDGAAQLLAGAIMQLEAIGQVRNHERPGVSRQFAEGLEMLRAGLGELRRLIGELRPLVIDHLGVVPAVQNLVFEVQSKGGPATEFHSQVQFHRLEPLLENVVYRIVQESLNNAVRHSRSERVRVAIVQQGERMLIEVRDWGVGFKPEDVKQLRFGLEGISERARLFGGHAVIDSAPGKGTEVRVELPVIPAREAG